MTRYIFREGYGKLLIGGFDFDIPAWIRRFWSAHLSNLTHL